MFRCRALVRSGVGDSLQNFVRLYVFGGCQTAQTSYQCSYVTTSNTPTTNFPIPVFSFVVSTIRYAGTVVYSLWNCTDNANGTIIAPGQVPPSNTSGPAVLSFSVYPAGASPSSPYISSSSVTLLSNASGQGQIVLFAPGQGTFVPFGSECTSGCISGPNACGTSNCGLQCGNGNCTAYHWTCTQQGSSSAACSSSDHNCQCRRQH